MFPFVILFKREDLIEYFDGHYFGQAETISQIDEVIWNIVSDLIELNKSKLKFNEIITWDNFCSCVNSCTYDNSVFFSIKYFDSTLSKWIEYTIDDSILETNFIKISSKYFDNKKIFYSNDYSKQIEKVNEKKITKCKNKSVNKSDFIIEF